MKPKMILFLLLLFATILPGQDILVLQNGEELEVIVKEVGIDEIKYVKFNNKSGPIYSESKKNIFMIKYENGTKDVFKINESEVKTSQEKNKTSENDKILEGKLGIKKGFWSLKYYKNDIRIERGEFINDLKKDPEAYAYYSKYKSSNIIYRFFGGISMLGAIYTVAYTINMQQQSAIVAAVVGVLAGVVRRVYNSKSKSHLELAILTYNKNLGN